MAFFLANNAVLFEPKGRRIELVLYLLPKFIESSYMFLERRNLITERPILYEILFVLSLGILAIGSQNRDDYVKQSYNNILN